MTQTQVASGPDTTRPLSGTVAIVTGAGKGLGAAISDTLAGYGARLTLVGRDKKALEARKAMLDARHTDCQSMVAPCDVLDEAAVTAMVTATVERFGGIDVLVNAAGGIGPIETPAREIDVEDFRRILELNVIGTFLPCKAVIPHLIERRSGRIVNIAGTSALRGYQNRAGYSASKWAVRGLTRTLALELGKHGITVNTVCPNVTHGERMTKIIREKARKTDRSVDEIYQDFANQTALGRFVDDVDVAAAVSFLISEGARNITGHDIIVDAGWDV
jgi:NAD(P)-dependent dehydrogenase (short-subunit alcohol dehydrogenase family)